jgi:hypothetical protein
MSNERSPAKEDTDSFLRGFSDYIPAQPNENDYILTHILKQLKQGATLGEEDYLKGKHGYEPVIVLKAKGKRILKRIFHPLDYKGADFAVSKTRKDGSFGFSVIQVKRNHGNQSYTLSENSSTKEITQLKVFSKWRSGYYLMVDETTNPPTDCFITCRELIGLIESSSGKRFPFDGLTRVNILNADVKKYCRGTRVFYEAFYSCWRGATLKTDKFVQRAFEYVDETNRALVELLAER